MSVPARIAQLDERTIGHIAAGEVVERPAQVVKELIENSIDAGAKRITVICERGGFDLMQVIDDGSGISSNDLPLALSRHATSKLLQVEDLNCIHTMGFRGEALASIGVVSELSIASRPSGEEGMEIVCNYGEQSVIQPIGMPEGTRITVKDIFANVPARLAFQRRPATESSKMVDVVVAHALANPGVAFRLENDGRKLLDIPSSERMEDRLFDLFGRAASDLKQLNCPSGDEDAPGEERWRGWISAPDTTRGKSDDIHILVNGRPVASQPFLRSIRRGYKTRLMQGRHPVAILFLETPVEEVDVNVHPTKSEVRLRHSWRVLERLERAIANTLESIPTEPDSEGGIPALSSLNRIRTPIVSREKARPAWAQSASIQLDFSGEKAAEVEKSAEATPVSTSPNIQRTLTGEQVVAPALSSEERELHRHSGGGILPSQEQPLEGLLNDLPEMEPLSQFADSYILVQADNELLLIDQHALHERIRYERCRHIQDGWESQSRITPLIVELDARQQARLSANQEKLQELGFELKLEGTKCSISSAPALLDSEDIEPFIHDILLDVDEDGAPLETIEARRDHIAFMKACKGAVKARENLNISEMRRLLEDMRRIPNPWACVHGRPTALRIKIDELDHHFGRHG